MQLPDYHIHTTLCNHATGTMEAYIDRAIAAGLPEIGFAEHMPVMPEPHLCMSYDDLPFYIDRVKRLQDLYSGRITIRLGAEMDMDLTRADEIAGILARYPFDYVIGSVHYLGDWPFDQEQYRHRFEQADLMDIYAQFFDTIQTAAKSGLYDIAGHIDNLKRMGYHPPSGIESIIEELACVLADQDVAVELNTSGYDYPAGEAYPSPSILAALYRHGVPVTTGSDAHRPEQVGRHFERGCNVLATAGYENVAYYSERRRVMKPLVPCGNETGA